MNIDKLQQAQERFFMRYPGGFSNPLMIEISKKHRLDKMNKIAQESFGIENFNNPRGIVQSMAKIVSQSSMVSIFEKPKFRDVAAAMGEYEKEELAGGLKEFFYGNQEGGFEQLADVLGRYKLAKWPLLTVCPVYFKPGVEVFVKPTTAKGVIEHFELEGLKYKPAPTFEFYRGYRDAINRMKKEVDPSLGFDNAAFCGFLLMSLENL